MSVDDKLIYFPTRDKIDKYGQWTPNSLVQYKKKRWMVLYPWISDDGNHEFELRNIKNQRQVKLPFIFLDNSI